MMRKVLIIKLRYIGDTLTLIPLVRALKGHQPEAHVSVMIYKGTEGILAYQKEIDEMILLDRSEIKKHSLLKRIRYNLQTLIRVYRERFDWVIDLTSSDRSSLISLFSRASLRIGAPLNNLLERFAYHELIEADPKQAHIIDYQLASLKKLGCSTPQADMRIFVPEEIEEKVRTQWASVINSKPLVVIHPGARGPLRQWREERFAQIADRLINAYGAHIILIGGPDEKDTVDQVEVQMARKPEGKTTSLPLIEVAALVKQAQVFIGNDTATGHIAAGVGTPHIILFGPTFPHLWAPKGARGICIFKSPDCCGCRQITCLEKENPCMDRISVEEVWNAAQSLL
jgi:predicted lipopolysaccharide heptosyltransferase III